MSILNNYTIFVYNYCKIKNNFFQNEKKNKNFFINKYNQNIKNLQDKYKNQLLSEKNSEYYINIFKYMLDLNDILMELLSFLRNKNIKIILGNTRSGKSTIINYLYGYKINTVKNAEVNRNRKNTSSSITFPNIPAIDQNIVKQNITQIKHNQNSFNIFPEVVKFSDNEYYVSVNHFNLNLNNTIIKNICLLFNTLFLEKLVKENEERVKLIILFESNNITESGDKKLINFMQSIFPQNNHDRIGEKILFIITKLQTIDYDINNIKNKTKTLKKLLSKIIEVNLDTFDCNNSLFFNYKKSNNELLKKINNLPSFKLKNYNFKPILNTDVKIYLDTILKRMVNILKEKKYVCYLNKFESIFLKDKKSLLSNLVMFKSIHKLNKELRTIEQELENKNNELDTQSNTINELEEKLKNANNTINELEKKVKNQSIQKESIFKSLQKGIKKMLNSMMN